MTPLDFYQEKQSQGVILEDSAQKEVMGYLQEIYHKLISEKGAREGLLALLRPKKLVEGMYIWGGVGIGKTFMMDCFYESLPFTCKMRMHFHQFLHQVHSALTQHQGEKDPLKIIAKEISKKVLVLCFDEFFVTDITDAMLLGRLLKYLFTEGVCLVTTSNVNPDDLYKHGLQRSQFLPAIFMLKQNTKVVHISTQQDYRLRHIKEAGVFYTPLNKENQEKMLKSFISLTANKVVDTDPISLFGRTIPIIQKSEDTIWFEFNILCHVPRSQNDYLAIAQKYHTVLISNIPQMNALDKDTICLFISMIDVFYDARIRLVISAAESLDKLYSQGYKVLEFARTHSRLLEMQSSDYFAGEFNHRN